MNSSNFRTNNETANLITGSIVAIFIAISPYIFYLYESFPQEATWDTWFFYFNVNEETDLLTVAWVVFSKMVPLYLLTLWFFTCKHWWYHVLLIPISMYLFQLISALNDDMQYIDEFEFYFTIPVMLVVIPLVYLVRIKLFDRIVHGIDLRKIDEELEKYDQLERELERESRFYQS